jgi:hypothetical protein
MWGAVFSALVTFCEGKMIALKALEIAKMCKGLGEIHGVTNKGPFIELVRGDDVVAPWCAAFVCWCFERANMGEAPLFKRDHFALKLHDNLLEIGAYVPSHPMPGDLIFWYRKKSNLEKGHVGIVESYDGENVVVIEGNHPPTPSFVKSYSYNYSELLNREWGGDNHLFKAVLRLPS